jgi:LPXTG-site transpeptidase (sortase) family protein
MFVPNHESFAGTSLLAIETPLPPEAGTVVPTQPATSTPIVQPQDNIETTVVPKVQSPDLPTHLSIPSIKVSSRIVSVGINSKGEMDVPSGSTKNVGWYKYGTAPGDTGSAVLDAHVFAAFSNLHALRVGSDIYVTTANNNTLHFVVQETRLYKLGEVPATVLFNRSDTQRLNLITCAGKLTANHSTYDHRLVVYAVLVN